MADTDKLLELTAQISAAYLANASVRADEVAGLVGQVFDTLKSRTEELAAPPEPVARRRPAYNIAKSVTPSAIYSLLDGKPYKTLKRHLSAHGLTPEEYRAEFLLPGDYPIVAAEYTARRVEMAKSIGLGRKPKAVRKAKGQ